MNLTNYTNIHDEWEPMIKAFLKVKDNWYMSCTRIKYHEILNDSWIADNIKGNWANLGHYWYFELKDDHTAFTLRWV